MQDTEIIALYQARDELAIKATAHTYGRYCFQIARNILTLPEDAEECVNDTYHAVWNHIPPDQPRRFRTYLGVIIRNLSLSRYRANRSQKRYCGMETMLSELSDCIPDQQTTEQAFEALALTAAIEEWLRGLPEKDRVLFLRRYWYADSVQTLAKRAGCTENAMALRLLKLRRKLQAHLELKGVTI